MTSQETNPLADTALGNAFTRAIIETIGEPFLVLDSELRIIVASRSFYLKFKTTPTETQGQLLYKIGNGEYDVEALRHFLKNVITERSEMRNYKIAHDFIPIGQRTLLLSAREVLYENSNHRHILLTIGDITDQEAADKALEKIAEQKDLLIREMKHRMANSLQLIASILTLKSTTIDSPEARRHLEDARGHIMSIATVEKYLAAPTMHEEVEVGPYLNDLCTGLSLSMIETQVRPISLTTRADNALVSSTEGISLGLITAELVINALKHAFPPASGGHILVTYKRGKGVWQLAVADDGAGFKEVVGKKEGLGTTIVQSLATQLHAKVDIQTGKNGTTVSINGALPVSSAKT